MIKKCNKCLTERDIAYFHKDCKQKDGYYPTCSFCRSKYTEAEHLKNREKRLKPQNLVISESEKYCHTCKTVKSINDFHNHKTTKDGKYSICKLCRKNKKELSERGKLIERNKLLTPEQKKERIKQVDRIRRSRPQIRIADQLRKRMNMALKYKCKKGSAVKDLGCSIEQFMKYMESKFQPGMSWDNYGHKGWHIDHIIPLAKFNLENPEEFKQACHYTNLQPLWEKDNLSKGKKYE